MRISPKEIQKSYAVLKHMARQQLDANRIDAAMEYIRHCCVLAQQFNWIYADPELEQIEKEIGERLIPHTFASYETDNNRVVLFDDFCLTYVLSLQYIEALLKSGKDVLLVSTRPIESDKNEQFFEYIKRFKTLRVAHIQEPNIEKRMKKVYDTIIDFHPSKLLLHIYATSIIVPVLYRLPKQIISYTINLADQTFWTGAGIIDYCIEFRPFGATISLERRGLKREQLLMLPFYPIHDKNPFEGFPKEADGHVTIFSGGDVYKTMDTKRVYWKLIKRILDTYPNVRFLFAAKVNSLGNKFIDTFIKGNQYEGRFIEVGFRKDIFECLHHCDIYMGTCPTSGSLMSQLAAINGTPILQYYYPGTPDDETEQALCINDKFQISFQDMDTFMQEADRLITDVMYRKQQGVRIRKAMIQPEQFDAALAQLLATNNSPYPVTTVPIDYKLIDDRWYEMERLGYTNTFAYIYNLIGAKRCLQYVPTMYIKKQWLNLKNRLL